MCGDTDADPRVSEEVIRENGGFCGGSCASRRDIGRAFNLDSFLRVFPPFP